MLDAFSINKVRPLLSIDLRRLYTNFFILLSIRHGVSGMLAYLQRFTILLLVHAITLHTNFQQLLLKSIPSAPFGLDKITPSFSFSISFNISKKFPVLQLLRPGPDLHRSVFRPLYYYPLVFEPPINDSDQNPIMALCSSWCLKSSTPPNKVCTVLRCLGVSGDKTEKIALIRRAFHSCRLMGVLYWVTGYRQIINNTMQEHCK